MHEAMSGPGQRVGAWLQGYGAPPGNLTPLLAARHAVRRRGFRLRVVGIVLVVSAYAGWAVAAALTTSGGTPPYFGGFPHVGGFVALVAGLYTVQLAGLWYQGRADRRIGATLPHRVARSVAVDLRTLLGGWPAIAMVVCYGSGLLVGLVGATSAGSARDRTLSAVFVAGIVLFAALTAAVLADAVRRPAVAEDDRSLIYDDLLRREDAVVALGPYPALVALVAAGDGGSGRLFLVYYGYAVAAFVCWLVWWHRSRRWQAAVAARVELQP